MTESAALLLEKYYEKCRSSKTGAIPVTVRFLESLIRLSQAHARLMFRNFVLLSDAIAIIHVMESSAFACGGFDEEASTDISSDPMAVGFSADADSDFLYLEWKVLQRYLMTECMDNDRREKVLELLASLNVDFKGQVVSDDWQMDASTGTSGTQLVTQDHYQRLYFHSQHHVDRKKRRH
jgi:hypothetical protein